jgi:hypothetical protein
VPARRHLPRSLAHDGRPNQGDRNIVRRHGAHRIVPVGLVPMRVNVTNCLLLAGAVGLVAVFRLPYAVGGEIALLERDALAIVRSMVAMGREGAGALGAAADSGERGALIARLHERCKLEGVPQVDLPQVLAQAPTTITLGTADYLFLMANVAPPEASHGAPADVEAWAWPRSPNARARTVFCAGPAGVRFTRNLTHRYRGLERPPEPGAARPRKRDAGAEYWGTDGQYWRPHPE